MSPCIASAELLSDSVNSLNDNKAAFDRYRLRPRLCRDVSEVDTSAAVWGAKVIKVPSHGSSS
jgi:isopentenyl diphosphate isomerase/L-lactate dehydrogenase-like FMN-dependent dehydrogenase